MDEEGYVAHVPALQGCYAQGDTYEEVFENIRDVIKLHLEDIMKSGQDIPKMQQISLTTVEISV